jgi:hypothetical protein
MAQLESQQANEAWYDPRTWFGGGDKAQPAAAAPAAAAPAATKPGEAGAQPGSAAGAQVGGGTTPPAANSGSAKIKNYADAMRQIKDLYAKAGVQYPPQDDIIRQRYGLPPALPAIGQWDGKMPQAGQADWLTRNVLSRDATKAVANQQAANNISNTANAKSDAQTETDVKQLTTLIDQLKASLASTQPVNNDSSSYTGTSKAAAAAPAAAAPAVAFNQGKKYGGYGQGPAPAPATLAESIARLTNKIRLLEEGDPQAIIKQIQDLMAKINGNNEDPPEDVAQALSAAQKAIDDAKTATTAKQTAQNQAGHDAAVASGQGDDSAGLDAAVAAQQPNGMNEKEPGWDSGVSVRPVSPPSNIQATDLPPVNTKDTLSPGEEIVPPTARKFGGYGMAPAQQAPVQSAAAPTQKKYGGYGMAETVGYSDEQALARIVELSRR